MNSEPITTMTWQVTSLSAAHFLAVHRGLWVTVGSPHLPSSPDPELTQN